MKRYVIFGDTIVKANAISKISVKPNFDNYVEFMLKINIETKKGKELKAYYRVVRAEEIEEKFGTLKETDLRKKGLEYSDAKDTMMENKYDNILRGIRKALNDDAILDAHEGDIFDYLDICGVLDNYKDQYLSLIRKTTDEEFTKMQKEHELEVKINELANVGEEDEERRREIYAGIKLLYKDLYHKPAPSLEELKKQHQELVSYRNFLRYLHDEK